MEKSKFNSMYFSIILGKVSNFIQILMSVCLCLILNLHWYITTDIQVSNTSIPSIPGFQQPLLSLQVCHAKITFPFFALLQKIWDVLCW